MNVYEARKRGREYCQTEGSDHYKGGVEPLDLIIAKGLAEDFCIGNMVKYAIRFKRTRNCEDLKKVADYAHILCGVEREKHKEPVEMPQKANGAKRCETCKHWHGCFCHKWGVDVWGDYCCGFHEEWRANE